MSWGGSQKQNLSPIRLIQLFSCEKCLSFSKTGFCISKHFFLNKHWVSFEALIRILVLSELQWSGSPINQVKDIALWEQLFFLWKSLLCLMHIHFNWKLNDLTIISFVSYFEIRFYSLLILDKRQIIGRSRHIFARLIINYSLNQTYNFQSFFSSYSVQSIKLILCFCLF